MGGGGAVVVVVCGGGGVWWAEECGIGVRVEGGEGGRERGKGGM